MLGPAELWLRALQRLTASVAHELRNPLNGVALNLEVLRGRVGRMRTDAAALSGFADAAVADLAIAIRLSDALLAVARPVRQPVELGSVLTPIAVLAGAVAEARGGTLSVELPDELAPGLAVDPHALRAALSMALLAAAERGATVRCEAVYEAAAVVVEVRADGGIEMTQEVEAGLAECGIPVRGSPDGIALRLPRVRGAAT
ncbi:MAG TPA: histidine kinase dimerization/phospho-acceptor domain-containing protein [Gemmatimonadaceae bacterium]|nr:histidine kinase dimerization/phospho-acceptor domain-containing protein [Gemmatimonadaceae bacterium]